jgi:glycosyltransferase involved in cell wall biosynthesis
MFSISAIIPTYNQSSRIERSINSVINQSQHVSEIIVVDDRSIDDTREVVQKIGYSVKYIFQDNRGPASARNTGIRNSNGDWVAFLDADDEWTPNHIRTAMELLKRHPEIVWYCAACEMRYENGTLANKNGIKLPIAGEALMITSSAGINYIF